MSVGDIKSIMARTLIVVRSEHYGRRPKSPESPRNMLSVRPTITTHCTPTNLSVPERTQSPPHHTLSALVPSHSSTAAAAC